MKVSVIIPYFYRKEYLFKVLIALKNQSFQTADYEVIIVDDGSDLDSSDMIDECFKFIKISHGGPARARNCGLKLACGKIVVFIDSDILVDDMFVQRHYAIHQENKNYIALGNRSHMNEHGKISNIDTRLKLLKRYGKKVNDLKHPWFMAYTCNVSLSRNLALLNPFDVNYIQWGLEDSEWAYRCFVNGINFEFIEGVNSIHLYHDREMNYDRFIGWKRNLDYTLKKHKDMCDLKFFEDVFNPLKRADYFEAYDRFEGYL
jgi:glycosyltransferase involved in cell wall biosynthesis